MPRKGELLATILFPVASWIDSVGWTNLAADHWRRQGKHVRIYLRIVRADGVAIECLVVVVREPMEVTT